MSSGLKHLWTRSFGHETSLLEHFELFWGVILQGIASHQYGPEHHSVCQFCCSNCLFGAIVHPAFAALCGIFIHPLIAPFSPVIRPIVLVSVLFLIDCSKMICYATGFLLACFVDPSILHCNFTRFIAHYLFGILRAGFGDGIFAFVAAEIACTLLHLPHCHTLAITLSEITARWHFID